MSQCGSGAKHASISTGGTQISFKDWKIQKECQNKSNTTHRRRQEKYKEDFSNGSVNNKLRPPPSLLNLNIEQNVFCNNVPFSFGRPPPTYSNNGFSCDMNYNNGCGGRLDFRSNRLECDMNINRKSFGSGNSFNGSGLNGSNFNMRQSPSGGHFPNTGNNSINMSDRFFQTDGFYHQRDMLQESNPSRFNQRSNELPNGVNGSERRNPRVTAKSPTKRNEKPVKDVANQELAQNLEPKIFVRNPNRKDIKKPFIPMPKHPESEPNLTTEERKQQWRDYREAMKPFKNKDFYNAKRVVQRLGKKDPSELDEKQKFRLSNAQEKMTEYKQKLAEKYDSYVKSADKSPNELGELFVLRKGSSQSQWGSADKPKANQYRNNGNFGESYSSKGNSDMNVSSGRKILGGTSNYRSFVQGGTLDSTLAK